MDSLDVGESKTSPLYSEHVELGARFGTFGDIEIPLDYGVPADEPIPLNHPLLADGSYRGYIRVCGQDSAFFLQTMLSADISSLTRIGSSCHGLTLTAQGEIIALVFVLRTGDFEFIVATDAPVVEELVDWLDSNSRVSDANGRVFSGVEVSDQSDALASIELMGPACIEFLDELAGSGGFWELAADGSADKSDAGSSPDVGSSSDVGPSSDPDVGSSPDASPSSDAGETAVSTDASDISIAADDSDITIYLSPDSLAPDDSLTFATDMPDVTSRDAAKTHSPDSPSFSEMLADGLCYSEAIASIPIMLAVEPSLENNIILWASREAIKIIWRSLLGFEELQVVGFNQCKMIRQAHGLWLRDLEGQKYLSPAEAGLEELLRPDGAFVGASALGIS